MRYIKRLELRDISLANSMISLGSCTMKLNAAAIMQPLSLSGFQNIHPFAPADQVEGYLQLIENLERDLATITIAAGLVVYGAMWIKDFIDQIAREGESTDAD